ncbi:glycosyltransferase family 2 protein [Paracoccus siganidrum]|uniref:Glycosyltransferase family 2 protein n=1 Tax=Paracoccus siganidrum TaxID=1276757 RepID=A0A419A9H0_9RHOB|nr:glycosyltransferase family 2 protein [Paracoccus siganidrum]RJL19329.1 glycosyltransferase family 2 protein [Paracoccus siganidrum]RMC33092.1 glycosyltransferase family 2 protein [Paracoccus siganidrum]
MNRPLPPAATGTALTGAEVLIVVPTLNEAAGIEACLRSLLAGDPRLAQADLVVADGGSSDATRAIVAALSRQFPQIRLIDNPQRLQSAGINRAVRLCAEPRHRILVRADAHATYPPGFAMRVADRLVQTGHASVVVPMDSRGRGCFSRAAAWIVDTRLGSGGSAHRGGRRSGEVDHGHHAAMELTWFRHVGGYDPRFSHNEDAELDHRLRQAGGRIWMADDLRLDYRMRPGLRSLARQYWNYGRGRARTCRKHGIRPRPRQIAPALNLVLLLAGLATAAAGLAAGLPLLAGAGLIWPLAYLALLAGASAAMALRHRSACGLLAGPALAAMHLPWGAGFLTGIARRTAA